MANPRSLPDGCVSAASLAVRDVEPTLLLVSAFLEGLGLVERKTFSVTCTVVHPDKLDCVCKAEVFKQGFEYVMEFNRMRGDSVLFALVFRLLRAYLQTGAASGPSIDPDIVPLLKLPPSALSGMIFESV